MGTCTVTLKKRSIGGSGTASGQSVIADVALSTSYATGGDTLTPASLGLPAISILEAGAGAVSPGGHPYEIIYPAAESGNILIRARDVATGAELANASNNSAQSFRIVAYFTPFN